MIYKALSSFSAAFLTNINTTYIQIFSFYFILLIFIFLFYYIYTCKAKIIIIKTLRKHIYHSNSWIKRAMRTFFNDIKVIFKQKSFLQSILLSTDTPLVRGKKGVLFLFSFIEFPNCSIYEFIFPHMQAMNFQNKSQNYFIVFSLLVCFLN